MDVSLVVAAARNRVIGRDGDMPWQMPSSLKQFRALTLGKPMIMGRKTFSAIGRVLDGRDTIVVTRSRGLVVPGGHVVGGLAEALVLAAELAHQRQADDIVIAGGGEIYAQALPYATRVFLDLIEAEPEGDTVFVELDPEQWQEVGREPLAAAPRDSHRAVAVTFRRIGPPVPLPAA